MLPASKRGGFSFTFITKFFKMKYTFSATTKQEIRTKKTATETIIYYFTEAGNTRFFLYDKSDKTTPDDDAGVLVSVKGLRFVEHSFNKKAADVPQNTQFSRLKIEGTDEQRAITVKALQKVKFSFDVLKFPAEEYHGGPHISWDSIINSGSLGVTDGDGWMRIETTLVGNPEEAERVILNESAHLIDRGFLTQEMRNKIVALVSKNNPNATWYPDYNKENDYESLVSECWHQIFMAAYIGEGETTQSFRYSITPDQAPLIWDILGVKPTRPL